MRPTSYRQAFRARWFVIVAVALIVTCLAVLAPPAPESFSEPSTALEDVASPAHARYQATAVLGVPPINAGGDAATQFKTIAFYLQSTEVGKAFAQRLGYTGTDFEMLGRLIEAEADEKSGVLTVKGYGGTAQQAADVTNGFVLALRDYLSGLGTQASEQSIEQARASVDDLKRRIDDLSARIVELRESAGNEPRATPDPQVAVLQAEHDALLGSYVAAYQHLTSIGAGGARVSTAGLAVLQQAEAATAEELGPSLLYELWLRIVLGLFVGLALGAALALLLEHNGRKIFSREAAEHAFGARVLAEIPRQRLIGTTKDLAVVTAPRSRAASAYRMLRVILLSEQTPVSGNGAGTLPEHKRPVPVMASAREPATPATRQLSAGTVPDQAPDRPPFTMDPRGVEPSGNGSAAGDAADSYRFVDPRNLVLVIAATANEPAHSAVVANLAASFAESGRTVAVLRIGSAARRAGGRGAVDEGAAPPTRATSVEGVRIVEWEPEYGAAPPAQVVQNLRVDGGVVLVDAGRVATAEFAEIAPLTDGVVAVCQIGRTTIENAERTADIVAWSHARLLGVVLAQVPAHPIERVTWGRRRRSPLTSRRGGVGLTSWRRRPPGEHDGGADGELRDDPLGLLPTDGPRS